MSGEWLQNLEEAVRRATDQIATLRRERDELREKVADLNTKLEAAAEGLPGADARETDEEAAAWREERREIRRRVEGLTETLEGLLEEAG